MTMKRIPGLYRYLPMLLLYLLIFAPSTHALDVKGTIDTDTHWTVSDSPVLIKGDLQVIEGVTLTIDPGVRIIFDAHPDPERGYNLTVDGTLTAMGSASQPIIVAANDPDSPWGAILFSDTSTDWDADSETGCILSYCLVEYGGNNADYEAMIVLQNAMPRIADSAIRFSSSIGIAAYADKDATSLSGELQIIDNQIYSNVTGVLLDAEGGMVTGNYFLYNGSAIDLRMRSNDINLQSNTIIASSDELTAAGIHLELEDMDSGISAYQWTQTSGTSVTLDNANSAQATFIAPNPEAGIYTLTFDLTVDGDDGSQATDSIEITVVGSNQQPVANAGADQNVVTTEDDVTLSGVGSTDPDNGIAAYRWEQTSGGTSVTLQNDDTVAPSFDVPSGIDAGDEMVFTLTVTDQDGLESTDDVTIRFYEDNIYPTAEVGDEITAASGDYIALDGSASTDTDGGITGYSWVQASGTEVTLYNADTATPYFWAPTVEGSGETLTFSLTVQDTGGLTDSVELNVIVKGTTLAEAGEDQTINAGDTVTLDGSGSADAEAVSSIAIQQNTIKSDNAGAGLVAITASYSAGYDLSLTENNVVFTDGNGYAVYLYDWSEEVFDSLIMTGNWWGTDDADVIDGLLFEGNDDFQLPEIEYQSFASQLIEGIGSNLTYPPLANAGADMESTVDMEITLDGSGSYDPEGIGTYAWQQVSGPTVSIQNSQSAVASFIAPSGGNDGQELQFSLTLSTGGAFTHTDEVSIVISPDESQTYADVGGGCFLGIMKTQTSNEKKMIFIMVLCLLGILFVLGGRAWRKTLRFICWMWAAIIIVFISATAEAGFFAVGSGGGGDADQYNITLETGAKDIDAGIVKMMFAIGMPFVPHGDENLPEKTIASECPNNDYQSIDSVRKGTEAGLYAKLGGKVGSSNLYLNVIGGFTVYTESDLVRSAGSGFIYEQSSDTVIEPLYGVGLSYFPESLPWPVFIQVDYDVIRGVTGSLGWFW